MSVRHEPVPMLIQGLNNAWLCSGLSPGGARGTSVAPGIDLGSAIGKAGMHYGSLRQLPWASHTTNNALSLPALGNLLFGGPQPAVTWTSAGTRA